MRRLGKGRIAISRELTLLDRHRRRPIPALAREAEETEKLLIFFAFFPIVCDWREGLAKRSNSSPIQLGKTNCPLNRDGGNLSVRATGSPYGAAPSCPFSGRIRLTFRKLEYRMAHLYLLEPRRFRLA